MDSFLVGDTVKVTWINSGVAPDSSVTGALWDDDETAVSSFTLSDSGDGHWYAFIRVPNTPGFYRATSKAAIDSNEYKNSIGFRAIEGEI